MFLTVLERIFGVCFCVFIELNVFYGIVDKFI